MQPGFLELTEELNALDYFEKAVHFMHEAECSDWAWKWVTISLHGALYGFAVCASQGTDSRSVHKAPGKTGRGREKLLSFNEVLLRCEKGCSGKPLILSEEERMAISVLKEPLRNRFEHYQPCHWSIGLRGFPQLCLHCVRVIETLATETSIWVHLKPSEALRVKDLAKEARDLLQMMLTEVEPRAT